MLLQFVVGAAACICNIAARPLAFAFSTLPPIRQFGILSSVAFVLSMIADFTALPASLWLLYRSKPDALMTPDSKPALPPAASA